MTGLLHIHRFLLCWEQIGLMLYILHICNLNSLSLSSTKIDFFVDVILILFLRMDEYTILESDDLRFILCEIYENIMLSYSSGCFHVRIFVRSPLVISYITRWMPGWFRKAGPGGIWKDSQGNNIKIFLYYLNFI